MAAISEYTPAMLGFLQKVPACVQPTLVEGVAASSCHTDLACFCRDDVFLSKLVKAILRKCSPFEQDDTLRYSQEFCSNIIPSLNDSQNIKILVIIITTMLASTVAVSLRFYARRISAARFGLDDLFILIALLFGYVVNILQISALRFGFGKHALMVSFPHIRMFLLHDWLEQIVFAISVTAARISLLFFYHRIFPMDHFKLFSVITGCFVLAWLIASIFVVVFNCLPVQAFWDRSIDGKCVNEIAFSYGITSSELAVNVAMLILPVPWLWSLHLPRSKKFLLGGIFLLGSFVCVSCIVRLPLLTQFRLTDVSWTIVPVGIWLTVECHLGIASVCLPILRPLFTNRAPHPVRSRFSAFAFSISKPSPDGAERLTDDETLTTQNFSGKTLTSATSKRAPTIIDPLKSNNDRNHHPSPVRRPSDQSDDCPSTFSDEPWGRNVGAAHRTDHQPWGQNIGAGDRNQEWELEILPPGPVLETGPRTDGRVEWWAWI